MAKRKLEKRPPPRRRPDVNPDSVLELVKLCGGFAQAARKMQESGIFCPLNDKPYSKHTMKRIAMMSSGWEEYQKSVEKGWKTFGNRVDALVEQVKSEEAKP